MNPLELQIDNPLSGDWLDPQTGWQSQPRGMILWLSYVTWSACSCSIQL